MTGLFLWALGLLATGTINQNYYVIEPSVLVSELEVAYNEQLLSEYVLEQKEIIIEDYFLFLKKIDKINYARGCAGEYTLPTRSEEKQKWLKCGDKSFDCSGLIKGYAVAKGILESKDLGKYNSQSLMELGEKKDGMSASRGDFTSRVSVDGTHFTIVSRDYDGGDYLYVYDNVNGQNKNLLRERQLKIRYSKGKFIYIGKRVISIYTNGLVDYAINNRIHVEKRIEGYEEYNPLGFSVIIDGFDYDSEANRIASYRSDNGASDYMIAKFKGESQFNVNSLGKAGERGLCQLLPNKTNNVWINDPRWNEGREFQAQVCLEKWNAVPNPDKIWYANAHIELKNISHL